MVALLAQVGLVVRPGWVMLDIMAGMEGIQSTTYGPMVEEEVLLRDTM